MRRDMHKVIVERKRLGGEGRSAKPPWEKLGRLEDMPTKEGIRKRHVFKKDWKLLNENLAPLKRYLQKQVGRPWNAVYREISRGLRVSSAVQQHVRDHVWDFVERQVTLGPDAEVYPHPHSKRGGIFERLRAGHLYVDPRTGMLRVVKPWRARAWTRGKAKAKSGDEDQGEMNEDR